MYVPSACVWCDTYTSPSQVQLKSDLRKLWIDHVVWTTNYIVSAVAGMEDQQKVLARINKDWDAYVVAFDKGEEHMIRFADILTEGIVKQFPNRF